MFKFLIIFLAIAGQNPQPIPVMKATGQDTFKSEAECKEAANSWLTQNVDEVSKFIIEKSNGNAKPAGTIVDCQQEKGDSI